MARPSSFSPELAEAILADVARGLFLTQVGLNNGVHPNTIRNWVRRGLMSDAEEPFLSFAERYIKAEVRVESGLVARIEEASRPFEAKKRHTKTKTGGGLALGLHDPSEISAADEVETLEAVQDHRGDWKAAAFLLERRFPKRWGQEAAETSERDSLDVRALLDEAESRGQDIDDLLANPPPELEEALLRHKDRLLALLAAAPTAAK
jgi:transposase-like protein